MKVYSQKTIWTSFVMSGFALFLMGLFTISMPFYTIKLMLDGNFEFIGGIILSTTIIFCDIKFFTKTGKKRMTLIRKNIETYKGKEICQMVFVISNSNEKKSYMKPIYCYTLGNNDLELNKDYIVTLNWLNGLANRVDNI